MAVKVLTSFVVYEPSRINQSIRARETIERKSHERQIIVRAELKAFRDRRRGTGCPLLSSVGRRTALIYAAIHRQRNQAASRCSVFAGGEIKIYDRETQLPGTRMSDK